MCSQIQTRVAMISGQARRFIQVGWWTVDLLLTQLTRAGFLGLGRNKVISCEFPSSDVDGLNLTGPGRN